MKSRRKTREIIVQVLYSESMAERGRSVYLADCKDYLNWLREFKSEDLFEQLRDDLADIFHDVRYKRLKGDELIKFKLPLINSSYSVPFSDLEEEFKKDQFFDLSYKIITDYGWNRKEIVEDELPDSAVDFFRAYLNYYLDNVEDLDDFIIKRIHNWDYSRVNLMDKIIIRMGLTEFLYFDDIPPVVTINEAIELGKKFSGHKSSQFINGILNSLKEIKNGKNS